MKEENKVDINFRPTQYTKDEAKEVSNGMKG